MKKTLMLLLITSMNVFYISAKNSENNEMAPVKSIEAITTSHDKLTRDDFKIIITRLKEIKTMDLQAMNLSEKNRVKREITTIHQKVKSDGGTYVYLSGTAIIIIILLLILL